MFKFKIISIFIPLFTLTCKSQESYPCPTNGNAESNSFSNWVTYQSTAQNPQVLNYFSQGFSTSQFGVHDANSNFSTPTGPMIVNGIDYDGGFPIPNEGTYCFRLGNNDVHAEAEAMRYTFTVTNANKYFKLRFAMVFEDGNHSGNNPAAWFYFVKGAKLIPNIPSDIPIYSSTIKHYVADLSNPYFKLSENYGVVYRPWECIEFDLSAYVGQTVSFIAMSRDCTEGGHFGYMYIDGLCTSWPAIASGTLNGTEFCLNEQILLDGAASEGEDRYYLEVAEMNSDNNYEYEEGGLFASQWFIAQQVSDDIDVSAFLASKNKTLECDKTYKVKLAVANNCSEWNETNFFFDVYCPEVDAGDDFTFCCSGEGVPADYGIGVNPTPGNTYSWTSVPTGLTADTPSIQFTQPDASTAYILEMTDVNGCVGSDTVLVEVISSQFDVDLSSEYFLCDNQPYVTVNITPSGCIPEQSYIDQFGQPYVIKWYFKPAGSTVNTLIQTGSNTIHAPNQDGTLTVTVFGSGCSTNDVSQTIQLHHRPGGHGFIAGNTFTPNGDGTNDLFIIQEFDDFAPPLGEGPAYGIIDFKLRIWNRVENFRTITKLDAGRAPNDYLRQGDIFWDGKNSQGEIVQDGVYNYTLEVQYCGDSHFTRVCLDGSIYDECLYSILWICIRRLPGCSNHVNLIR